MKKSTNILQIYQHKCIWINAITADGQGLNKAQQHFVPAEYDTSLTLCNADTQRG